MRSHVVREVRGLRAGVAADGADERPDAGVDAQVRLERVGLRERAAAQVAAEAARPGVDQLVPPQVADRREALAAGGAAAVARRAAAAASPVADMDDDRPLVTTTAMSGAVGRSPAPGLKTVWWVSVSAAAVLGTPDGRSKTSAFSTYRRRTE